MNTRLRSLAIVFGIFALLLTAYHGIFGQFFPMPNGMMGSDYTLTLAGFLDGFLWFRNNGILTPPWFTPSFCGGQAYFADPQSAFYSIPQFLAFFTDPLTAVYAAVLIFAAIGFWGMYILGRRTFGLSQASALVAACIFMFNGFYSHRMIIGHYGYQPFMLVPWVAWLLCLPADNRRAVETNATVVLATGLLIAYWLQAGLTTLMLPSGLAVLALVCLADMRRGKMVIPALWRGIGASLLAIMLSASKLVAGLTLINQFPRTFYPLPGIADSTGLLAFVLHALFYSSEHAFQTATPLWKNMQWAAMPHELAFGLTFIPLMILLLGLLLRVVQHRTRETRFRSSQVPPGLLLAVILLIPLLLLYYTPEWNGMLKKIPIIGSTTSPYRWLLLYIPILCVLTGIAADCPGFLRLSALACLIGVPTLNALENRTYYESQTYDPRPVLSYHRAIQAGEMEPRITHVAIPTNAAGQVLIDNNLFTRGFSPLFCYNPLFGYRQENYNPGRLRPGPVTAEVAPGKLNLRNPACLLYPQENQCQPWDTFEASQHTSLENFATYRPFEFSVSHFQKMANLLTLLTLMVCAICLPLLLYRHFRKPSC